MAPEGREAPQDSEARAEVRADSGLNPDNPDKAGSRDKARKPDKAGSRDNAPNALLKSANA